MASQPANTSINVFRRIRSQRNDRRHESIRSILSPGLRELLAIAPGEEVQVIRTRDSVVSDRFRFGHYVTVLNREQLTLAATLASITDVEVPFLIGRDKFFNKDLANVRDDVHAEVRALSTGAAFVL